MLDARTFKSGKSLITSLEDHIDLGLMKKDDELHNALKHRVVGVSLTYAALKGGMVIVDEFESQQKRDVFQRFVKEAFSLDGIDSIRFTTVDKVKPFLVEKKNSKMDKEISNHESNKAFDAMMQQAHMYGAEDVYIYLSKKDDTAEVMFKVDGLFIFNSAGDHQVMQLRNYALGRAMVAAKYDDDSNATESIGNYDDASQSLGKSFQHEVFNSDGVLSCVYDVRFEKNKTLKLGEASIVLRLAKAGEIPALNELKLEDDVVNVLKKHINKTKGAIVISGPTGAGKNTTLMAALVEVPKERSVQTLEDPVERVLPRMKFRHIIQNTLDKVTGSSKQLQGMLRQSPDCIYVSEVREEETAKLFIDGASSGHIMLTTTHANSAPGTIERLNKVGVSFEDLSGDQTITLIIAQRLLRVLCEHCKVPANEESSHYDVINELGIENTENVFFKHEAGCKKCRYTGEKGRQGIIEYIEVDDTDREFILRRDISGWIKHLKSNGFTTLRDKALDQVMLGRVDPKRAAEVS